MKKSHFVRSLFFVGTLVLQLHTPSFSSRAAAGDVDLTFDPGSGINGAVHAIVVQPDGKVLIGGEFTTVKGLARRSIARLNADGSGDVSFAPSPCGYVFAIALQPDGKIIVGHQSGLSRLQSDGTVDSRFNPIEVEYDENFYGPSAIVLQPDGKIIAGGPKALRRLNADGSNDSNFLGEASGVISMKLQPDGKVLVGGYNGIQRLHSDGSFDSSFAFKDNLGTVKSIALSAEGKVLIGGNGIQFGGTNYLVIRLNSDGTLDRGLVTGQGSFDMVRTTAVQADGKIIIAGELISLNGTLRPLTRLNDDGSRDTSFDPGMGSHDVILSLALQPDGKILIGGDFTIVDGTTRKRMARLHIDGGIDASFDSGRGIANPVYSLAVQPDGKVLIGGVYTFINGTNRYGAERLNPDGSLDTSFVSDTFQPDIGYAPTNQLDYNKPYSLAVQSDGKVLVGGLFFYFECDNEGCTDFSRAFLNRVHADGSRDTNFNPPEIFAGSILPLPDGKVLIGGDISLNGTNYTVARLNADGSLDGSFTPFAPQGTHAPQSLAVTPDGKILVGGYRHLTRLNADGSLDSTFNVGLGVNDWVLSIAVQPNGKVLIGGTFTEFNGTNQMGIARLNSDGSLDSSFDGSGPDGSVSIIGLQPNGDVLIGGEFTTVDGFVRPSIARLNGYPAEEEPSLKISRLGGMLIISWAESTGNYQIQEKANLLSDSWSPITQPAVANGGEVSLTIPNSVGNKFFRLISQ